MSSELKDRKSFSSPVRVGCAGWSIPGRSAVRFEGLGSHLHRYSMELNCCEINSSFRRSHQPATWERWAMSVAADFRFSVKLPRSITHDAKLACTPEILTDFLRRIQLLGNTLGPVLVQTPPSLGFETERVSQFLSLMRRHHRGDIVWEARHTSWFGERANKCLADFEVGRVASDPGCVPAAAIPGGYPNLAYYRLHGSPRPYYSRYPEDFVKTLALELRRLAVTVSRVWCVFDNTALGWAIENALEFRAELDHANKSQN